MEKTIQLKTNQLTIPLIEGLRKYFDSVHAEDVVISFSIPNKTYLRKETQEDTNQRIENAVKNMGNENFVSFSEDEFNALSNALLKIK